MTDLASAPDEITVEQWMAVLQDPETTKPNLLEILQALHARPHHGAGVADLGAELGYPRNPSRPRDPSASQTGRRAAIETRRAAGVIAVVNAFGKALGKNHGLEIRWSNGKRVYWALPFYSAPLPPEGGWPEGEEPEAEYGVDENGFFIWILWPELAEAMERLGLTKAQIQKTRESPMPHAKPQISVEQWMEILQDPATTTVQDRDVFRALYARPHHRAAASQLGADLGRPGTPTQRGASMNRTVVDFGKRLDRKYGLKSWDPTRPGKKQKYWPLPFYSGPHPPEGGWGGRPPVEEYTSENGLFIWILRPELAEAMERLGLVGEAAGLQPETGDIPEAEALTYVEGACKQRWVNAYERDGKARDACLAHHGRSCKACGFDFGGFYGEHGRGFIHVHHLKPLSEIGEAYEVNPKTDLVPLCPNCHAMIHRGREAPLSLEALREIIAEARDEGPL